MAKYAEGPLPDGRAALARALCTGWVSEQGKVILLSFLTLLVLSFTVFQLTGKFSAGGKSDYLEVQKAFSIWSEGEQSNPKAFRDLEKPLARHPELQAKFGNHIAQRLLSLGDADKAGGYIAASLKRTRELVSPYYSRFTKNTLVIAHGKYAAALEEAIRLKADLERDDAFWEGRDGFIRSGAVLYAYNLLRIAVLQGQAGSKEDELKAWDELVLNAGWKEGPVSSRMYDPEAYALLEQNFTQGDVSLLDFIEQKRKELLR